MKTAEIVLGGTYSNGKGRIRKVVAVGAEYKLADYVRDEDGLQYEIVHDGSRKNLSQGERHNMTRNSFASWAKEQIFDN